MYAYLYMENTIINILNTLIIYLLYNYIIIKYIYICYNVITFVKYIHKS